MAIDLKLTPGKWKIENIITDKGLFVKAGPITGISFNGNGPPEMASVISTSQDDLLAAVCIPQLKDIADKVDDLFEYESLNEILKGDHNKICYHLGLIMGAAQNLKDRIKELRNDLRQS